MGSRIPSSASTLPELLEQVARRHPTRGVSLFDRRARQAERRTYPELLAAARLAARRWSALGVEPGDRILVCLPSSWSLVDAWLGAMLCGALPVAIAPPSGLGASDSQFRHLEAAVTALQPRHLICSERLAAGLPGAAAPRAAESALATGAFESQAPAASLPASSAKPEDTAFLQLTSGSTGAKRAVVISHRAVLHNAHASDLAIGMPKGRPAADFVDAMVAWLPLHHDMGLVGCLFFSIHCGFELCLLPPEAFLARPESWLRELATRGTTITAAPNFAFGLCVERAKRDELAAFDLSGWSDAMVGAEMIRPETMSAFSDAFAAQGFDPRTLRPCYGLAEATLAVAFDQRGEGLRTARPPLDAAGELAEVVSTGQAIVDTEIRICDESGKALPEREVGEVRVRGPSVFDGYWNDEAATAESLKQGWLCTGDLGFLREGELYLVGRRKEILIVRGENLMPHELEWIAEAVVGQGGACRAGAFSVPGAEGEEPVLVVESPSRDGSNDLHLAAAIRERIGRELSLALADVTFVKRGTIPKTTSGKVQRHELRRRYLGGELS